MFSGQKDKQIKILKDRIETLEKLLVAKNSIKGTLDKLIPKEEQERKNFVSDVTINYERFLKKLLLQVIEDQKDILVRLGLTERESDFFRSNINVCNLIDEWCLRQVSEHGGNMVEIRESQEDKSDINNIKEKYNV